MRWFLFSLLLFASPAPAAQLLFAGGQWVAFDRGPSARRPAGRSGSHRRARFRRAPDSRSMPAARGAASSLRNSAAIFGQARPSFSQSASSRSCSPAEADGRGAAIPRRKPRSSQSVRAATGMRIESRDAGGQPVRRSLSARWRSDRDRRRRRSLRWQNAAPITR